MKMKIIIMITALAGFANDLTAQHVNLINQANMVVVGGTKLSIYGNLIQKGGNLIGIDDNAVIILGGNLYNDGTGTLTSGITGTIRFRGDSIRTNNADLLLANLNLDMSDMNDSLRISGNLRITDQLMMLQGNVDIIGDSLFFDHLAIAGNRLGQLTGERGVSRFTASKQDGLALSADDFFYTTTEVLRPINKSNLGLTVTMTGGSGGSLNVKRYHQYVASVPNAIVGRAYEVTSTNNPSAGVVTFSYFDSELGDLSSDEDNLRLFQSIDNGVTWNLHSASVNKAANSVTSEVVNTVNGLWVLSTCTYPEVVVVTDGQVCADGTIVLSASSGTPDIFTYQWYADGNLLDNETAPSMTLDVSTGSVAIELLVTNEYGCTQTVTQEVIPNAAPVINLGDDITKCQEAMATLQAPVGFVDYRWLDDNNTVIGTGAELEVDAGVYRLIVRNEAGCEGSDQIVVGNYEIPFIDLPGEVRDCGESATIGTELESVNNASFTWYNDTGNKVGTTPAITVLKDGRYQVEIESEQGCKTRAATNVVLNTNSFADLGEDISVSCESVVLDAGHPGSEYQWSEGGTNQQLKVTTSGVFWVEISHPNGCIDRDTVQVEMLPPLDSAFYLAATETYVGDTVYFIGLTTTETFALAWDFDDGHMAEDDLFPQHIYNSRGEYYPRLHTIFPDGCEDSYQKLITITEEVISETGRFGGRNDLFRDVIIFPNPNQGLFKVDIDLSEQADVDIKLINIITSQLIDHREVTGAMNYSLEFDYRILNPGFYSLRIKSQQTVKSYRVVIIK